MGLSTRAWGGQGRLTEGCLGRGGVTLSKGQTQGARGLMPQPCRPPLPPRSILQNLLPVWHRVPRVHVRPLRARGGVLLPLGAAPPEPR